MAEERPELIERFVIVYEEREKEDKERFLVRIDEGYVIARNVISALDVAKAYYMRDLIEPEECGADPARA